MSFLCRFFVCFSIGAIYYPLFEVAWRGYTHFSMAILGGLCFSFIYFINEKKKKRHFLLRALYCSLAISASELACGIFLNVILDLRIWDYSKEPFNLFGQICPYYSFVWFLLSIICFPVCNALSSLFSKRKVKGQT